MVDTISARIALPGDNFFGYTATGSYAIRQLKEIASICGVETTDGILPESSFRCDFVEVARENIDQYVNTEPGVMTLFEPCIIMKIPHDMKSCRVYIVPGENRTQESLGFLWRRLFYLGLLPCAAHLDVSVVHGILAEYNGKGVIISGPSGVGKSTAARRLPPPWRVMSDDCLIVSKCADGFYAQSVPTWSVFYAATAPQQVWNCRKAVKLNSIFLLDRGADYAEKMDYRKTLVGFTRSVGDMTKMLTGRISGEFEKNIYHRAFDMAANMARELPAYHLFATLHGEFWKNMELILEGDE